jgi:hypothetical protein
MRSAFTRTLMLVAIAIVYWIRVRPWFRTWGSSTNELVRTFPGDELIPEPRYVTTRAITINASPGYIWPWLVQMGQGRAGLYSYDWLENIAGLDFHSADSIISELQNVEVGDHIRLAPDNQMPLAITVFEPERALVLRTGAADSPQPPGNYVRGEIAASWAFILEPIDETSTRFIVRWRADWTPQVVASVLNVVMLEPIHFIMEQAMMRGIRDRAQKLAVTEIRGSHRMEQPG